ncbi:potassium:hydrogen antiporter [Coprinopsis cinerea AmutBmut pab1-1]|nr:potassium:hydrogen antiporter [Coprinopsis cinerea AmutBmut pab1-1]
MRPSISEKNLSYRRSPHPSIYLEHHELATPISVSSSTNHASNRRNQSEENERSLMSSKKHRIELLRESGTGSKNRRHHGMRCSICFVPSGLFSTTMGEFARQLDAAAAVFARAAAEQGGVISGDIPTDYSPSNPFRLWVIQVVIIIAFSQILALVLGRIRQPRVIAEVIGGILLGPTVMGRIPNFKETIFPEDSMPLLTLTATVGLILFLFLVGLEIDTRLLKRSATASATVSIAGLVIPLGLGAALGVGVYNQFIEPEVNFGYFLLFVAVAVGITAFPVLCRILTELKLLDTQVGVVVLSAGIGNDVIGWVLLALTVALVNSTGGLTALWVLLATVGYTIFLLYPVRWGFVWLCRRTGSLEQGSPTPFMMTVTLMVVFVSAFFTDIIGVHAIFGGFMAGLIIPHENGFAISLVEKIEDLISILFIPIYFTLSGLKTNLGLLNSGVAWGYTILICVVAFAAKFLPCAGAAFLFGFKWREAGAIGTLMSCKGLVELIVLNIGLQANILNDITFSMFVVHALVLTFVTTPLTLLFYPPQYRTSPISKSGKGAKPDQEEARDKPVLDGELRTRFALVLEKVEQLAPAMTLTQLLQPSVSTSTLVSQTTVSAKAAEALGPDPSDDIDDTFKVEIDTLRLMELSNRTSDVIRSKEADALIYNDPVVSAFRTFGSLNRMVVSATLSVVSFDQFSTAIAQHATDSQSEMVIIPWARGTTSLLNPEGVDYGRNPFDGAFHRTTTTDQTTSVVYSEFIRSVFLRCPRDVALFVDRGAPSISISNDQHLFLPFFGGPDDRLALNFLVQLCVRSGVQATVVRIQRAEEGVVSEEKDTPLVSPGPTSPGANHLTVAAADTVYGQLSTQARLASDTEDNLIWERYAGTSTTHSPTIASALTKIAFSTQASSQPLHTVIELAKSEAAKVEADPKLSKTMIVLAGRSRRMAVEALGPELRRIVSETGAGVGSSAPKTLGDVGAALVATGVNASLLIMQAAVGSSRT